MMVHPGCAKSACPKSSTKSATLAPALSIWAAPALDRSICGPNFEDKAHSYRYSTTSLASQPNEILTHPVVCSTTSKAPSAGRNRLTEGLLESGSLRTHPDIPTFTRIFLIVGGGAGGRTTGGITGSAGIGGQRPVLC